jgi:Na+/pantothenate symporter
MVPDEYHEFFLGVITVGGALIGLLFVAISVRPGNLEDDDRVAMRVRATAALLAFLDAVFLSLVALLPGASFGRMAVVIGSIGSVSMITLLVAVLRRRHRLRTAELFGALVLIAGQLAAYVLQLIGGQRIPHNSTTAQGVGFQATLMLVLIFVGVFRAWEYVGGPRTGILGTVDELRHHTEPAVKE